MTYRTMSPARSTAFILTFWAHRCFPLPTASPREKRPTRPSPSRLSGRVDPLPVLLDEIAGYSSQSSTSEILKAPFLCLHHPHKVQDVCLTRKKIWQKCCFKVRLGCRRLFELIQWMPGATVHSIPSEPHFLCRLAHRAPFHLVQATRHITCPTQSHRRPYVIASPCMHMLRTRRPRPATYPRPTLCTQHLQAPTHVVRGILPYLLPISLRKHWILLLCLRRVLW